MVFNNKEGYIVPKKKKGPLKEVAWEEVRKKYKFYWVIFEVVTKKSNGDRDKVILHGKWKTRTGVYRAAARLARPSLKNNLSMEYIADPWDLPIQAFIASKKGGQEIKKKREDGGSTHKKKKSSSKGMPTPKKTPPCKHEWGNPRLFYPTDVYDQSSYGFGGEGD